MNKILNYLNFGNKIDYKTEVLSGLTVAIALVPEAVAFAFIAGLSPLVGLYAAFMMGLVTALFGGRPAMISGATGAVAVVLVDLVRSHGVDYIFATVILAGLIQMASGALKLGRFIRLVPHSVVFGFVNGLALIIFLSQIDQFKDSQGAWMQGSQLGIFVALVALTMGIIWLLPRFTKVLPASLAAILAVFALAFFANLDTRTVGDMASIQGGLPPFALPKVPYTWETLQVIFPYALVVAAVGFIESLLTLELVDELTETRGQSNREAAAQGLANVLSGLFSGMGGCAMIGQSLINVSNGARSRISGMVAAVMLLVFVVVGAPLIERVPMAALTGLMIMVSIGTFEWTSLRIFNRMPKADIFVMLLVMAVTLFLHNLALAVFLGVVVSALVFAWDNAKRIRARKRIDEQGVKHYEIYGPLFFGSIAVFHEKFDPQNDPEQVILDFSESRLVDMSALEALNKVSERYRKLGKHVKIKGLDAESIILFKQAGSLLKVEMDVEMPSLAQA